MKKKPTNGDTTGNGGKVKCTYCYDKGYSTVATGGTAATGDFIGDKPFYIPFEVEKRPCPRCTKTPGIPENTEKQAKNLGEKNL